MRWGKGHFFSVRVFFCFLFFLWRLVYNIFLSLCCCFISLFVLFYLFYFVIIIFSIAGLVFFPLLQNAFAIVDLPATLPPRRQKLYGSSPSQWTSLLSSYDRASCFSNVLDNASLAGPIRTLCKSKQNLPTSHEKRWSLERLSDSFVWECNISKMFALLSFYKIEWRFRFVMTL